MFSASLQQAESCAASSAKMELCFGDGQQVIRCLDAALCSIRARVLMNESVPVGRSRCLNARENTVLGSLWCGDKRTMLGKEWKCVHVRYACTYCSECHLRNVGNICNVRVFCAYISA